MQNNAWHREGAACPGAGTELLEVRSGPDRLWLILRQFSSMALRQHILSNVCVHEGLGGVTRASLEERGCVLGSDLTSTLATGRVEASVLAERKQEDRLKRGLMEGDATLA